MGGLGGKYESEGSFVEVQVVKLERDCGGCRRIRRGAAAVEFAIVAPVFVLMVFGMIEFGRAIMVQQVITNAAREGARYAVLDGSTSSSAKTVVNNYLSSGGVAANAATVKVMNAGGTEVEPSTIGYGETVTVAISIPYTSVTWLPAPWFLKNATLSASTVMRRETVE
jgi:Flp pilus assembly protein TadG